MSPEDRLRAELTRVRLAPAYQAAVGKGIYAGLAAWPDEEPEKQLTVARRVALRELAAFLGWDIER